MPFDLFGHIPVTWSEVHEWVETHARIPRDSWRAKYYIEHWNVPEKIRAEKRRLAALVPRTRTMKRKSRRS